MLKINRETSSDLSEELEDLFKALGNINRILLVHYLASQRNNKVSVSEMAKIMGLTQPAASQHLRILKTAQILRAKKEGNHIYYTFNYNALKRHKQKIDFLFSCALDSCKK